MIEPEGRENMLKLAESYTVGVWMLSHVTRTPSLLPRDFWKNVVYRMSTLISIVISSHLKKQNH